MRIENDREHLIKKLNNSLKQHAWHGTDGIGTEKFVRNRVLKNTIKSEVKICEL
jgi:hypothetical protein